MISTRKFYPAIAATASDAYRTIFVKYCPNTLGVIPRGDFSADACEVRQERSALHRLDELLQSRRLQAGDSFIKQFNYNIARDASGFFVNVDFNAHGMRLPENRRSRPCE